MYNNEHAQNSMRFLAVLILESKLLLVRNFANLSTLVFINADIVLPINLLTTATFSQKETDLFEKRKIRLVCTVLSHFVVSLYFSKALIL